jgi:isocitrate dehydrogenase
MIDPGYDMMTPTRRPRSSRKSTRPQAAIWATHGDGKWKKMLLIKDSIADITLQQVLTRPKDFDVIAT